MKRRTSTLERKFELCWLAAQGPRLEREYRFDRNRKWRFDWAFPRAKVAIEVEGGVFSNGRHSRGRGFEADCEKYNAATIQGWKVFRLTGRQISTAWAEAIVDWLAEQKHTADLAEHDRQWWADVEPLLTHPHHARMASLFRSGAFTLGYRGGRAVMVVKKE